VKKLIFLPPATLGGRQNKVYRVFALDTKNFITDALQTESREEAIVHLEALKQKYKKGGVIAK